MRGRNRLIAALAVVLVGVGVVVAVARPGDPSDPPPAATRAPAATATRTPAATAVTATPVPAPAETAKLGGATALEACAAGGDFWPTMVVAIAPAGAWVACKEEQRVVLIDTRSGAVAAEVRLNAPAIAVVRGLGSLWALDSAGTLYRIDARSGEIGRRIALDASAPYNLWIGAGSVWAIDDAAGELIRVDPDSERVVARIEVGDGPADMAFRGPFAWVVNHRDRGLVRLDTRTDKPRRLATLDVDAPERVAWLAGKLWITGRGTDLLRVEPATGRVSKVVDVGASGIDVVAAGGALWVPSRSAAVDPTGFPTMNELYRVTPDGRATVVATAAGHLDVHGLTADASRLWLADTTEGLLYRFGLSD